MSQTHLHAITKNYIIQTGNKLAITRKTDTCILTFCESCSSVLSQSVCLYPCCTDLTGILRFTKTANHYVRMIYSYICTWMNNMTGRQTRVDSVLFLLVHGMSSYCLLHTPQPQINQSGQLPINFPQTGHLKHFRD